MQEFLSWLASLRGIQVESGSELRFEFAALPSGGLALLLGLAVLLLVAFVYAIYRRDGKLPRWQRLLLASLRTLAILAALAIVLEPNLVAIKKDRRDGHAIILLDVSQSMGHIDAYREGDPKVEGLLAAWEQLGVNDPRAGVRLDLAKKVLSDRDFAVIRKLSEKNEVRLFKFSTGIEAMDLVPREEPKADPRRGGEPAEVARPLPIPDLAKLDPSGRYSNIGGAIRAAVDRSRGTAIAAVVVLTDGRRNIGAQAAEVARFLTQRKVDHTFLLGVGDPAEAKTVSVTRIEAPEKAFQKDPFKIRATVASEGYDKQTVSVRLRQVPVGGGEGVVIENKQVELGGDTTKADLAYDNLKVDKAGAFNYRVEVVPPTGEPASVERHAKEARIEILDQQTRVLLIAGSPMHEYQTLRNLLIRDTTIEVSCWLLSADKDFPQDGNVSLKTLPMDRKELEPFDVFILMDPDERRLERSLCEMIVEQVQDAGAGLWWVCGEKYTLKAARDGAATEPLARILPIRFDFEKAELMAGGIGYVFSQEWPFVLTPEGRDAKPLRLLDGSADENAVIWSQLPGWHFGFPIKEAKPAAQVWVETDREDLRSSRGSMPLIASQLVGAGRVLFSATDEIYRWRGLFADEYDRFWVKGIRYLFEGRLRAGNSRLRISLSADKVELGEPLKITVDAKDEAYQPLTKNTFELQITRGKDAPGTLTLQAVDGVAGQFETTLHPERTGFYQLVPVEKQRTPTDVMFQVVAAAVEKEGSVNLAELGTIAEAKGGVLVERPDQLLSALDRVQSRTTVETFKTPYAMWDSWFTIAIILVLLTIEWWLRKRFNLL